MANQSSMARVTDSLMAELARLEAIDLADRDALRLEVSRAKAVQGVAREVNASAANVLATARLRAEWAGAKTVTESIRMLGE